MEQAIDLQEYLQATKSRQKGQYVLTSICDLMNYLFSTHGNITAMDLDMKVEIMVKTLSNDSTIPIDSIFDAIEELNDYAPEAAETTYSPQQLINIGYIIVLKNPAFHQEDIVAWLLCGLTNAKCTWPNFVKTHFRAACKELRTTQGPTVDSSHDRYANSITDLVLEKLHLPHEEEHPTMHEEEETHHGQAAAIQSASINDDLTNLLKQLGVTVMSSITQQQ